MKIKERGGNQYEVTIGDETKLVDLDGVDCFTNEDYARIVEEGVDADFIFAPMHNAGDEFWAAAVEYVTQNSRIDIDDYILCYL